MNDLLINELAQARLADLRREAEHRTLVRRTRRLAAAVRSALAARIPRQRGPVPARSVRQGSGQ